MYVETFLFALIHVFKIYTYYVILRYYNGEKERNKIIEIICYTVACIFNFWSIYIIKVTYIAAVSHFMLSFILSLNYYSTILTKIKASLLKSILSIFSEIAVVFIAGFNVNKSIDANKDTFHLYLSAVIVEYVTITYISNWGTRKRTNLKNFFKIYILLMFTVAVIYLSVISNSESMPGKKVLSFFLVLLYVFSSIVFLYIKNNKEKKLLTEQRDRSLYRYETARNAAHMLASIHININSHVAVLRGLIKERQNDAALDYLSNMSDDIIVEELVNSGNRDFDSIINLKIAEARQKGITILPDIVLAERTKINGYAVANILGLLFDVMIDELQSARNRTLYFFIDSSMGPVSMWFKHTDEMEAELRENNKYKYRDYFKMERVQEEVNKYHGTLEVDIVDQTVETFVQVVFK